MILKIMLGLSLSLSVHASTFVGNGGNAGDVELLVTKKQLINTLIAMAQEKEAPPLCTCSNTFWNHPVCNSLKDLNPSQVEFCAQVLKETAGELAAQLQTAGSVYFHWTHEPISVVENNKPRAADAVTHTEENRVTINQRRFTELSPTERVFLLAHEVFHLAQWQGQPLQDEGAIGPFQTVEGGRILLNALASATVMRADFYGAFDKYVPILKRPQGWKRDWIDVASGSTRVLKDSSNTYYQNKLNQVQASYRHYWSDFGVILNLSVDTQQETIGSTIKAEQVLRSYGVGLTYRYFHFDDPLSFWGQSHLVADLLAEYASAKYDLHDNSVGLKSTDQSQGMSLSCRYYIPVRWDLWGFIGLGLRYHDYQFKELGLDYASLRSSVFIGASYGF